MTNHPYRIMIGIDTDLEMLPKIAIQLDNVVYHLSPGTARLLASQLQDIADYIEQCSQVINISGHNNAD